MQEKKITSKWEYTCLQKQNKKELFEQLKSTWQQFISTRDIACEPHVTALNHLNKTGYTHTNLPHELAINGNEIDPFLKRLITDDEKWIRHENFVRTKKKWHELSQMTLKLAILCKIRLCCVFSGNIRFDECPLGLTLISERFYLLSSEEFDS